MLEYTLKPVSTKQVEGSPQRRPRLRRQGPPIELIPPKPNRVSVKPVFKLADIPEDWEIRLHPEFVKELDKLNRPWKYDPTMKRGDAVYWRVSTMRKRTLDRMTAEQKEHFKRELNFTERLFTWTRKPKNKRGKKFGIWMLKSQIDLLREGIDISDEELEKAITAFRLGGQPSRLRAVQVPRMPIVANKWWAWIIGLYYSTGTMNFRSPEKSTRSVRESMYIHFRAHNPVCVLAKEVGQKIGLDLYTLDQKSDRIEKKTKSKGLRTGRKPRLGLGWAAYMVLQKFGMSTFWREDKPEGVASRYWKPVIPDWILKDDECMMKFVEALINGGYGVSAISRSGKYKRSHLLVIYLRIAGAPEDYVKKFAEQIRDWMIERGLSARFRKFTGGYITLRGKFCYEIALMKTNSIYWILDNMVVARPDLRARLIARLESRDDPVFNEALFQLRSPHNVLLGMLLEKPLTTDEIYWTLQMRRDAVVASLRLLQRKGLIERGGDRYYYAPETFIDRTIRQKEEWMETLAKRAYRYSSRLLYRCTGCLRIYVRPRETCGMCAKPVEPVTRHKILQSIHSRRRFAGNRLQLLKEVPGSNPGSSNDEGENG